MSYQFRTAIAGLWREKWINFLCMLTIASGLFLIAVAFVFVTNIGSAARKLPERFSVMVFLKDGLPTEDVKGAVQAVRNLEGIRKVRYISKEEALRELKTAMEDSDYVLEGLEENPLPASIELGLKKDAVTDEHVRGLAKALREIDGVEEVQYGAKLLSIIQSVSRYTETMGFLLISVLSAGVVFVCYSTVKILFYRKKSEIDTLKLLGATKWFIRSPFLIEGGVIGLAGGLMGVAAMVSLHSLVFTKLTVSFPLLKALTIPGGLMLYPPLAGLAIGVAGAMIAIGRIRF